MGFVYLAVVEGLIRAFKPSWVDWLVGDNAGLFLMGDLDVNHLGHSQTAAGLLLALYTTALVAIAIGIFRNRDIA